MLRLENLKTSLPSLVGEEHQQGRWGGASITYTSKRNLSLNSTKKHTASPRLIFYIGFLLFLVGNILIFFHLKSFEFVKVIGTAVSIYAVIQWLRTKDLADKFKKEKNEDGLTYFWNKIAIRLWSGIFFAMMLSTTATYLLMAIFN